jgi:hypothetical protein
MDGLNWYIVLVEGVEATTRSLDLRARTISTLHQRSILQDVMQSFVTDIISVGAQEIDDQKPKGAVKGS